MYFGEILHSVHRLTYSEALADVICAHGDKTLRITDTCLALAQMVYLACGIHWKAALTMCKRGLTFCALEFIQQNENFTNGEEEFSITTTDSMCYMVLFFFQTTHPNITQ